MALLESHLLLITIAIAIGYTNNFISYSNRAQWAVDAFIPPPLVKRTHAFQSTANNEEWRAFRANLVQNGLRSLGESENDTNISKKYAHTTTPLVEKGSIMISIPTSDLCQALDQQYWHRSVVLITDVSDNSMGNIEDMVPEEQLAEGDKRGRWSYRGLFLNRFTNLKMFHDGKTTLEESRDIWHVQRGGDLLGLESSSDTQFSCLHQKSIPTKPSGNLYHTKLAIVQDLCRNQTEYNPNDFLTFCGFCAWRPGQLEREMGNGREEWMVLSVDDTSIWEELLKQRETCRILLDQKLEDDEVAHGLLEAGTTMWRNFLSMIHVEEAKATEKLKTGQLEFYDQMLKVWAEEQLVVQGNKNDIDEQQSIDFTVPDSSSLIKPGTIVRAKSPPTKDILLYDAELIRCIILVIEDTPEATVGIILNHPMAVAIDCVQGEDPLPLRYGGAVDVPAWRDGSYRDEMDEDDDTDEAYEGFLEDSFDFIELDDDDDEDYDEDDDDDGSQFIWIHRSINLGLEERGGIKLGNANFWVIKEDDALEHLQSGFLDSDELMVFSGVSIWEKGTDLGVYGGGLREQVDSLGAMEIVRFDRNNNVMDSVWDILATQTTLTKDSLESNINAATKAWKQCSGNEDNDLKSEKDRLRERLSDAALKAWIARNLLEDPLNTFVEVLSY